MNENIFLQKQAYVKFLILKSAKKPVTIQYCLKKISEVLALQKPTTIVYTQVNILKKQSLLKKQKQDSLYMIETTQKGVDELDLMRIEFKKLQKEMK